VALQADEAASVEGKGVTMSWVLRRQERRGIVKVSVWKLAVHDGRTTAACP
jgi:hypothetical protein